MQTVHRAHANERTDLSSRLDNSESTIAVCRESKAGLENQYRLHVIVRFHWCRLEEMQTVHRAHANERTDLSSRLDDSESTIAECTQSKAGLENQYRFFQEMRGYVTDLVECLNEKVGAHRLLADVNYWMFKDKCVCYILCVHPTSLEWKKNRVIIKWRLLLPVYGAYFRCLCTILDSLVACQRVFVNQSNQQEVSVGWFWDLIAHRWALG